MVDVWQLRWSFRRCAHVLLEEADVEDIMETSVGRQLQTNSDLIDALDDAIRPVEPGFELATRDGG